MSRPAPRRSPAVRRVLLAAASCALLLAASPSAAREPIPGPPLDAPRAAAAAGAFCPARGDAGLGGAGFASAVAAIAWVGRRRRIPA